MLAIPMLQLLKIVFTFGKELLIALCQSGSFKLTKGSRGYQSLGLRLAFLQLIICPKNERQQGKRRVLGSKMKYWIENIWKNIWKKKQKVRKRACFSPYSVSRAKGKTTKNDAGECLLAVPHRNWKTNTSKKHITRSNRDKSPYNVHIKDKTGVLTCGQFKSVNNYSERRAKAKALISHKSIALLSRYKSLGALIVFSLFTLLLPISTKEASSIKDF